MWTTHAIRLPYFPPPSCRPSGVCRLFAARVRSPSRSLSETRFGRETATDSQWERAERRFTLCAGDHARPRPSTERVQGDFGPHPPASAARWRLALVSRAMGGRADFTSLTRSSRRLAIALVALVVATICGVSALPPPLSGPLVSLLSTAGVYFNFSQAHPLQPAQWVAAPSGDPNAGLIRITDQAQAIDFGPHDTTGKGTDGTSCLGVAHPSLPRLVVVALCRRPAHVLSLAVETAHAALVLPAESALRSVGDRPARRVQLAHRLPDRWMDAGQPADAAPHPVSVAKERRVHEGLADFCSLCALSSVCCRVVPSFPSQATWINLEKMEGAAHVFSALEGGFTLSISIDGSTRKLQLIDNNYAFDAPIVCASNSPIPIAVWTLVAVTQYNTTGDLSDSRTELRINGILDASCTGQPYWDSPIVPKTNIYVGLDAVSADDTMHASLAMWCFWYRPLTPAEHVILANEDPSSVAGPLPLIVFPPPETGVPLLDYTPRVLSVVPQTSLRGTSTFTVCLTGSYPGGVSPACLSWSSGVAPTPQTFSLTNPPGNTGGAIQFTWSSSFVGTGMPGGYSNAYWQSLFVLPSSLSFTRTPPRSQIDATTIQWAANFGPQPTGQRWEWKQGAAAGTGYAFFNFFNDQQHRVNLLDSAELARIGASPSAPPPTLIHSRAQGFSFGIWLNMTTDAYYYVPMSIYKHLFSYTGGPPTGVKLEFAVWQNLTVSFTYDTCSYTIPSPGRLSVFQWQHFGVSVSEAGVLDAFWNGARAAGPVSCGPPLADFTGLNPTLWHARIGSNQTGVYQSADPNYWPMRVEIAQIVFHSRTLVAEEWRILAMTPPANIWNQPMPFTALNTVPLTLAVNEESVYSVVPGSWYGGDVTMYFVANVANVFVGCVGGAGCTDATADGTGYAAAVKLSWSPSSMTASAGMVKSIRIRMPSSCINMKTFLVGDTANYRGVQEGLDQQTICVTSVGYLQTKPAVRFDFTTPPVHAPSSVNMANGYYIAALRNNVNDYMVMAPSGGDGSTGAYNSIIPSSTTGFTVLFHVMQLREMCSQIIWIADHYRFRMHCSGYLHAEIYPNGWVDYVRRERSYSSSDRAACLSRDHFLTSLLSSDLSRSLGLLRHQHHLPDADAVRLDRHVVRCRSAVHRPPALRRRQPRRVPDRQVLDAAAADPAREPDQRGRHQLAVGSHLADLVLRAPTDVERVPGHRDGIPTARLRQRAIHHPDVGSAEDVSDQRHLPDHALPAAHVWRHHHGVDELAGGRRRLSAVHHVEQRPGRRRSGEEGGADIHVHVLGCGHDQLQPRAGRRRHPLRPPEDDVRRLAPDARRTGGGTNSPAADHRAGTRRTRIHCEYDLPGWVLLLPRRQHAE